MLDKLKNVEREIGYEFKNIHLLKQAFIRKTYSEENEGPNNEVLEHIGDSALNFAVEKILVEAFTKVYCDRELKYLISSLTEAQLTEKKKMLVQKTMLAHRIDKLNFKYFLLTGNGDDIDNISVKEDLFEAIIGAVAVDCNYNIDKISQVVDAMLSPFDYLANESVDYVSEIQNWCLKHYGVLPSYEFASPSAVRARTMYGSYEITHIRSEKCNSIFNDGYYEKARGAYLMMPGVGNYCFVGSGESNSLARKDAAKIAYEYLERNGMLWSIKDEVSEFDLEEPIGQLQKLADRGYISKPKYTQREERDENGNSIWYITCCVDEYCNFEASNSTIKKAKKEAAYNVLIYVLENYQR